MRGPKPKIAPSGGEIKRTPKAPKWFGADAAAEWKRSAPILIERKALSSGDWGVLENYCLAMAAIKQAQADIDVNGIVLASGKRNPAFSILDLAMKTATRLAQELGLTPVSRTRLGADSADDDDEDDYL